MDIKHRLYGRLKMALAVCSMSMLVTSCGPSPEKVAEAQQKYAQLAETHNQVAEAHKSISEDSLDASLMELRKNITEIEAIDLTKIKEEEIDALIQRMDDMIASYQEFYDRIASIKEQEEAAVLVPVSVTLFNQTDISFTELKLYRKGDNGIHENVLSGIGNLEPEKTLTGLVVQRDVKNTPWVLELKDGEEAAYEFLLPVREYDEEGVKLSLVYDEEQEKVSLESKGN